MLENKEQFLEYDHEDFCACGRISGDFCGKGEVLSS